MNPGAVSERPATLLGLQPTLANQQDMWHTAPCVINAAFPESLSQHTELLIILDLRCLLLLYLEKFSPQLTLNQSAHLLRSPFPPSLIAKLSSRVLLSEPRHNGLSLVVHACEFACGREDWRFFILRTSQEEAQSWH